MKIFLSYGHDLNAPLIEKIKEYLSKDAEGNLKHEVWIDMSRIKAVSYEHCATRRTAQRHEGELSFWRNIKSKKYGKSIIIRTIYI